MKSLFIVLFMLFSSSVTWATSKLDKKLLSCSLNGDFACVQEALEKGADITNTKHYGKSALETAIIYSEPEIAQFLIENYITAQMIVDNISRGGNPLHSAAKVGQVKTVQALIEKYTDIKHIMNQNTLSQGTALHVAVTFGRLEVVQLLLREYPEPKYIVARDKEGETALHKAASFGDPRMVQLLIDALPKAEYIMARNKEGNTALHQAASLGSLEAIRLLIKAMPKEEHIMAQNKKKETPLHQASFSEVAQLLIDATPKKERIFTIKDDNKETPFHRFARRKGPKELQLIVKTLPSEDHFLDKNISDQTPFEITLDFDLLTKARVIFGLAPLKIKKQFIKICQNHHSVDQQFCNQLIDSLKTSNLLEIGGYQ